MGGACCVANPIKCEYNISTDDSKRKSEIKSKTINTMNFNDKSKEEDRCSCSILINTFRNDINYIVSYKESEERKILENKLRRNLI